MKRMFISYSHEDVKQVKSFAWQLSLRGFDLWMDEKDISGGSNFTTEILKGIHNSDIYLVFISAHSVESSWVNAEIDFAMKEKIERKKLKIVPILLDDTEIPVPISNIDYIDARFSIRAAAEELSDHCGASNDNGKETGISLASISFTISEKTAIEVGPFNEGVTVDDLEKNKKQIIRKLRKRAFGILMNFVSPEDFDFQSVIPKFKNGLYEEGSEKVSGGMEGSVCEKAWVEAIVFNPDEAKVDRLLNQRLEVLSINAITFGYTIPLSDEGGMMNVGKRCFQKIQDEYLILSYDNNEGAKIEISDDFFLSLIISDDVIKIKLSTTYDWQFARKMKGFSAIAFLKKLLDIE